MHLASVACRGSDTSVDESSAVSSGPLDLGVILADDVIERRLAGEKRG